MSYATPADCKLMMELPADADESLLQICLDAATKSINNYCNRPGGFLTGAAAAREFSGDGSPAIMLPSFTQASLVEVKATYTDTAYVAWAGTDWIPFAGDPELPTFWLKPYNGLLVAPAGKHIKFTNGRFKRDVYLSERLDFDYTHENVSYPTVRVTATWGYADNVPEDIRLACIIQACKWFKRGKSAFADTMANAEFGVLLYKQTLDPDVKHLLMAGRYIAPMGDE